MNETAAKTTLKRAIALFSLFAIALLALLFVFREQPPTPQIVTIIEQSPDQEKVALLEEELLKARLREEELESELNRTKAETDVNSLAYAAFWRAEAERLSKAAQITGSSLKEVEALISVLESERSELKDELTKRTRIVKNEAALKEELDQAKELKTAAEKRLAELGNEVARQRKSLEALQASRGTLMSEMERTKRSLSQLKEIKTPQDQREVVLVERVQHTVRPGETLISISEQYYGTSKKWRQILDANLAKIPDERKLKPGILLEIPAK